MKPLVSAEFLRFRTTKAGAGLALAMLGLVLLAVLLHGFGLDSDLLSQKPSQLRVLTAGESVGVVFAALLGALSMTTEFRHGTIRPTLLATPQRPRVVWAKAIVNMLLGATFGALAAGAAAVVGQLAFSARDIPSLLTTEDLAQLVAGGAVASGLWAAIGLGIGALVRSQVPAIIGIFLWLQIVENLLIDSVPSISQYMPGALGHALAGSEVGVVDSAVAALLLLALYAAAVVTAGVLGTVRSDIN